MAPTAPSKRRSLRTKLSAKSGSQQHPVVRKSTARVINPVPDDSGFTSSKRDKRSIKHSSFVSRIEKTTQSANKKALKRRRPNKKLVANLDSLADALPDLLADGETEEGLRQLKEGKVRHKSLWNKKGALKKKERVVKGEVERFGISLARLNAVGAAAAGQETPSHQTGTKPESADALGQTPTQPPTSTSSRWAALRGFISATMEQNPAFIQKQDGK